ncbi:MAG TPA: GNAT family N-acetyltransferase [Terriglobales bacterium]|nr:GNAT family N-acetyltransferase [Terriglobales bacterium]
MSPARSKIIVRNTRPEDFAGIAELSRAVYADSPPWSEPLLASHLGVFPEGQFVAIETATGRVVGMAASLIILWDDYDINMDWTAFTDGGLFTNHDPEHGRTLYGAEIMVEPSRQRSGIGGKLYRARRELVERLGLLRIRAGARLRGYHRYAHRMSAEEYVTRVVQRKLRDATLSFQLRQGFEVLAVVSGYLHYDPESLGYAAVIEWLNLQVAKAADYVGRNPRFIRGGDKVGLGLS